MSAHDPHYGDEDEESEDDFNPAPANDSEDEEPSPQANKKTSRRAQDSDDEIADADSDADAEDSRANGKASRRDDDEDNEDDDEEGGGRNDDDEEDEEDDEDEDDVQGAHQRKRRKRDRRNQFFDIEAEVEDEDEAEDDEKDGEEIGDFIDNEHPDDIVDAGRLNDDRRHRDLDRQRDLEQDIDAEKQAAILKERYAKRRPARGLTDAANTPRRLLLPGVDDPKIWAVRAREGKEREAVYSINKRIMERRGTKDALAITCAFERAGTNSVMKGYIYVEAFKLPDILANLDGVMNVYPRTKCMMIDIKEMPDLLRVIATPTLQPGSWVRLKRPFKHNGDLAQVMNVTENGLEARVKWIPRIDYALKDAQQAVGPDGKRKRAAGPPPRPPQRLFNEVEARKKAPGAQVLNLSGGVLQFRNEEFESGYQVKDIKIHLLQTTDVNPTLEEVTKFATRNEDGTETLDLKSLAATLKDGAANSAYLPGDVVEVYEGEQRGVIGKATNVQGDIVTIQVTEGALRGQTIEVPMKGLRKRFRAGDHVKVIGGQFRDEVGMVVKIDKDKVTLLTDQNHTEVTVFSSHLREASDIGGQGSLGQYSLLDLVQLDATTVACIVKVDRESFVVLDQNGDTRQIMPTQISNLLPKRKTAVAADREGSEIRLDDVVKEAGGQQRQGKILHIHRSFLFMHNNTTAENAGVFVTRSSNVRTIAAKGGRINTLASGPDLDAMNPALKRNSGNNSQMNAPQKVFGRDRALGHTVTIRRGGYKGLLGVVKDTTDTHARIELHTKGKIITVAKADLTYKDKVTGRTIDINTRGGGGGGGRGGGYAGSGAGRGGDRAAPAWENGGSRTPQVSSSGDSGSRTPAWGSRSSATSHTPAWSRSDTAGSRTPAWGAADGSRTVNPYDGSRTAYGGSGSRTPAWSAGAKTPAHDGFSMGSKTPAYGGSGSDSWGAGSKTPAYASAPTPAANNDNWGYTPGATAFDAPTPGVGLTAPTPGALNAPTPGAYSAPTPAPYSAPTPGGGWQGGGWGADSAPTPAVGAPTPGAYYSAPTPAAYGGAAETPAASGPRYADDDDD